MLETKYVTNQTPHPFYLQLIEHVSGYWTCLTCGAEYGRNENTPPMCPYCSGDNHVPSTEAVCAFLLFKAIEAARDSDSDEMMFWQRAYLDVRSILKIGFDFDTYFENHKLGLR